MHRGWRLVSVVGPWFRGGVLVVPLQTVDAVTAGLGAAHAQELGWPAELEGGVELGGAPPPVVHDLPDVLAVVQDRFHERVSGRARAPWKPAPVHRRSRDTVRPDGRARGCRRDGR